MSVMDTHAREVLQKTSVCGHDSAHAHAREVLMARHCFPFGLFGPFRAREVLANTTKLVSFLYDTGMSIAESTALVASIGPLAGVVMGSSAAASAMRDAVERGGTNKQALLSGLASGAAEMVFERFSIEGLLNMSADSMEAAIKNVLKQGFTEASEELNTEIANIILDGLIMGKNSAYNLAVEQYMQQGMSREQAEKAAMRDNITQTALAAAGGFLSGGASGGVFTGGNAIANNLFNTTEREGAQLLQNALAIKEGGTPAQTQAPAQVMGQAQAPAAGAISGKEADRIMADPARMEALGIDTNGMTKSQARSAVKQAVSRLASSLSDETAQGRAETLPTAQSTQGGISGQANPMHGAARPDNTVASQVSAGYNGITRMEDMTNGEEVYLRNGSQRAGSAYPSGQVSAVEEGTGRGQSGQAAERIADRGAASLTYGERVSTASLGIGGGSSKNTVRILKSGDTQHTAEAKRIAKERGLRVTFFSGDNLSIRQKNGEYASVRGYITGDRVFIRADHPLYTADQIMRHEAGHDMIAKGEVNVSDVRKRIAKTNGRRQVKQIANMYTAAYEGTGMTAEEIWEEVICDSLGDMNIFAGKVAEDEAGAYLSFTKDAAQAETVDNRQERGPPADGKASRETGYKNINQQAWRQIQRERMSRYGGRFDTMPRMDALHAHDMLFVIENFDETSFGVIEAIDPAKNQEKANVVWEVMKDGNIEYASEYRRRVENLRRWQRRNARNTMPAENTRAGGNDAGASDQYGVARDRGATTGESSGADQVIAGKASRELDNAYMSAVERGDMENAQRMVDKAARNAGYSVRAYHGTDADAFNVFDRGKIGAASGVSILGDGFYFAEKRETAKQYGKNVYAVYLKQKNSYEATADDTYKLSAAKLETEGYDGVTLPAGKGAVYMVLDPEQIKSAEPVTYDNNGNVIPLSERFNPDEVDIRFSMEPTAEFKPKRKVNVADVSETAKQAIKDAQLAGMMNQGRKDAEKLRKAKDTTAEVRRKRDETIQKIKDHQREIRQRTSESRNATAIRTKIQRHVAEMSRTLRNPTDKKHVPETLRGPVAKLLESINLESRDGAHHPGGRGCAGIAACTPLFPNIAEFDNTLYSPPTDTK